MTMSEDDEGRPASLAEDIERLRNDHEFVALVDEMIERDREILDRLADT